MSSDEQRVFEDARNPSCAIEYILLLDGVTYY